MAQKETAVFDSLDLSVQELQKRGYRIDVEEGQTIITRFILGYLLPVELATVKNDRVKIKY